MSREMTVLSAQTFTLRSVFSSQLRTEAPSYPAVSPAGLYKAVFSMLSLFP